MDEYVVCRRCFGRLATREAFFLWDNNWYCFRCVELASARLAERARDSDALVETVVPDRGWRLRGTWFYTVPAFIALALCVVLGGLAGLVSGSVFVSLYLGAAFLCDVLWMRPKHLRRAYPKSLSVSQGVLTITTPAGQLRSPIVDCKWFEGRLWDTEDGLVSKNQDAIVLLVRGRGTRNIRILACGSSVETREQWKAFLSLAGVPETTRSAFKRRQTSHGCTVYLVVLSLTFVIFVVLALGMRFGAFMHVFLFVCLFIASITGILVRRRCRRERRMRPTEGLGGRHQTPSDTNHEPHSGQFR